MKSIWIPLKKFLMSRSKTDWLILLLMGVLLLVLAIPASGTSKQTSVTTQEEKQTLEIEQRLTNALSSMEGVGKVKVMITTSKKDDSVEGVLVVAQGASSAKTSAQIMDVVKALFGIETHKIRIVKMSSEG